MSQICFRQRSVKLSDKSCRFSLKNKQTNKKQGKKQYVENYNYNIKMERTNRTSTSLSTLETLELEI